MHLGCQILAPLFREVIQIDHKLCPLFFIKLKQVQILFFSPSIDMRTEYIRIIFETELDILAEKGVEHKFTVIEDFDQIVIMFVHEGRILDFRTDFIQILPPSADVVDHKVGELPVVHKFFSEHMFGHVVILVIEKIILR